MVIKADTDVDEVSGCILCQQLLFWS
jgi:hypothetical protein